MGRVFIENKVLTTSEEKHEAACLLARSFKDSLSSRYIFQNIADDEIQLLSALTWLYEKRLKLSELSGNIILGRFQDNVLVSTLNVGSNESQYPTPFHLFQSGMWYWPLRLDVHSFRRFMELGRIVTTTSKEKQQNIPLHLMMVATDERFRGNGHAAELIKYAMAEVKGELCLDTQCPENLNLYKKLGFTVTYDWVALEGTPWAYRNYLMQTGIRSLEASEK